MMKLDENAPAQAALGDRMPAPDRGQDAPEPTPGGGGPSAIDAFETGPDSPDGVMRTFSFPPDASADTRRMDEAPVRDDGREAPKAKAKQYVISPRAADYYLRKLRDNYVFFGMFEPALRYTVRQVRRQLVEKDGFFDLRPRTELETFVDDWKARNLPTRNARRRAETADIASLRRAWEKASRSGDPDAMTRTANALIRAVEAEKERLGPHEATHAFPDDGRHTTSQILAPQDERKEYNVYQPTTGERMPTVLDEYGLHPDEEHDAVFGDGGKAYFYVDPTSGRAQVGTQSNADAPPRHVVTEDGVKRVAQDEIESDLSESWAFDTLGDHGHPLTQEQVRLLAKLLERATEIERVELLGRLRQRFGETVTAAVVQPLAVDALDSMSAGDPDSIASIDVNADPFLPNEDRATASSEVEATGADTMGVQPQSLPLSYRERSQPDHDRSGGDIGRDFDEAIDRYFGFGFTPIGADRVVPSMGRIAMEKVLKRPLKPVEVEALQAIRVLGRRLTRAERAELLSRNVIRGRLAEEATAKFFKAFGFKVWAQNATIVTKAGIRRIDVVVRDRRGRFYAIESKAGGAARNSYQKRVDLEIERNGGVFVGERAGPLDGVHHRMETIVMHIPGI